MVNSLTSRPYLSTDWQRGNGGPLYMQLISRIEHAIGEGYFKAGDPLPSERELAQQTGLSRVTVRKAVQDLAKNGLVVQRRGSGTFIAPLVNKVEQSLSQLTSFTEDMSRRGNEVRSLWLERGIYAPSPEETMALGLAAGDLVSRVNRIRLADEVPLAIERATLSTGFLPDPSTVNSSLYMALERLGCKPVRAVQRISATNINASDAALLDVAEGVAGLNIVRVSYLFSGKVVEYTRSIYRGDAYDFVAELKIGKNSNLDVVK